jgi:hypothetical protein
VHPLLRPVVEQPLLLAEHLSAYAVAFAEEGATTVKRTFRNDCLRRSSHWVRYRTDEPTRPMQPAGDRGHGRLQLSSLNNRHRVATDPLRTALHRSVRPGSRIRVRV